MSLLGFCEPAGSTHCSAWPSQRFFAVRALARRLHNLPSHHYEKVQAVPRVSKVTLLAENPQSHHLDHHLNGKERKDEVIKVLQRRKRKRTDFVLSSMGSHKTPSSLEPVLSNQRHVSTQRTPPLPSPTERFNCLQFPGKDCAEWRVLGDVTKGGGLSAAFTQSRSERTDGQK